MCATNNAGTVFALQLTTKEGTAVLAADTISDAILNRIVSNVVWIGAGEFNVRQRHRRSMLES